MTTQHTPKTWQHPAHTWTDQSASGWTAYRKELERLRGKPFNPNVITSDLTELCHAQSSFECGIMPIDHLSGFFSKMSHTEAEQKMLDYKEAR